MAIICTNCFYPNKDNYTECISCGESLQQCASSNQQSASNDESCGLGPFGDSGVVQTPAEKSIGTSTASSKPEEFLAGRVSRLTRSDEAPEKLLSEYLAKALILILILIPYLILFVISGIMAVAVGILGLTALALLLNPFSWTMALAQFLELFVLSRLRGGQAIPVYRGTVRDEDGSQRSFVMVGPFRDGDFDVGDDVEFQGSLRNGTFRVKKCLNLTTRTTIVSQHRNLWPFFLKLVIVLYAAIGLYIFWRY